MTSNGFEVVEETRFLIFFSSFLFFFFIFFFLFIFGFFFFFFFFTFERVAALAASLVLSLASSRYAARSRSIRATVLLPCSSSDANSGPSRRLPAAPLRIPPPRAERGSGTRDRNVPPQLRDGNAGAVPPRAELGSGIPLERRREGGIRSGAAGSLREGPEFASDDEQGKSTVARILRERAA
jgi:hypothetical protein